MKVNGKIVLWEILKNSNRSSQEYLKVYSVMLFGIGLDGFLLQQLSLDSLLGFLFGLENSLGGLLL